jgi:hypothetical protein
MALKKEPTKAQRDADVTREHYTVISSLPDTVDSCQLCSECISSVSVCCVQGGARSGLLWFFACLGSSREYCISLLDAVHQHTHTHTHTFSHSPGAFTHTHMSTAADSRPDRATGSWFMSLALLACGMAVALKTMSLNSAPGTCVCVCVCVYRYVKNTHIHTHTYIHTLTYIHTHTHTVTTIPAQVVVPSIDISAFIDIGASDTHSDPIEVYRQKLETARQIRQVRACACACVCMHVCMYVCL